MSEQFKAALTAMISAIGCGGLAAEVIESPRPYIKFTDKRNGKEYVFADNGPYANEDARLGNIILALGLLYMARD